MNPIYVAYYTSGDYERHAAELAESLDRLGLPHTMRRLPDVGSWVRNCAMKPEFVLEMMEAYPGKPIVYLDADARVRQRPDLFYSMSPGVDIACHYLHRQELLSGTLYFGGTIGAVELARDWHARCQSQPDVWDQKHLQAAVDASYANVTYLPLAYCYIFDHNKLAPEEVVIEHLQESRNQRMKGR